jgi:hypothetical protein
MKVNDMQDQSEVQYQETITGGRNGQAGKEIAKNK